MKVTQLERQKKNTKRFNVFLDGKFAFGADEDTIVNFRLIVGKEISSDDLEKILFETQVGKLVDRVFGLLGRRNRSEKEIRDYLKQLSFKKKIKTDEEISEVVIDSLINKLKNRDLINDKRFAVDWIEGRGKTRGPQVLKSELFQKGIPRDIIDEVFSEQTSEVSQEQIAEIALERKHKSFSSLDPKVAKKKATDFLLRRGFDYDTVRVVVENFIKKSYNNS